MPTASLVTEVADAPRTRTIKFRNPRKLGAASESWLRHDVRNLECTAATWRYLVGVEAGLGEPFGGEVPFDSICAGSLADL